MLGKPLVIEITQIQQQLKVDIDNARDILGAFDVARHPVKTVGNAAQHGLFVAVKNPSVLAAPALRGIDDHRSGP